MTAKNGWRPHSIVLVLMVVLGLMSTVTSEAQTVVDPAKLEAIAPYVDCTFNAGEMAFKDLRKAVSGFVKDQGRRRTEWKIFETSGTAAGQKTAFGLLTFGASLAVVGFTMDTVDLRLSNLMAFHAVARGNWGCRPEYYQPATKLVLVDESGDDLARAVRASGVDYAATAASCLAEACDAAGFETEVVRRTVATGYGRRNVQFADDSMTEIHCHGVGCFHHLARAITIVDIGGQDNKVIHLAEDGRRIDFRMNRKCAAGTGAFIEEIALRLDVPIGEMDPLASSTEELVRLSSFCTVFAKTEILAHLRAGAPVPAIVRGAFQSVVLRVVEMAPLKGDVVLTGGVVAHHPTVGVLLGQKLGRQITVPPHPQFTGALGAALLAAQQDADKSQA